MLNGPLYLDFNIGCIWGTYTVKYKKNNLIVEQGSFILNRCDLEKQILYIIINMKKRYDCYGLIFTERTKHWYNFKYSKKRYNYMSDQ